MPRFWTFDTTFGASGDASDTWFVDQGNEMSELLDRLLPRKDDEQYGPITHWDPDTILRCTKTRKYTHVVGVIPFAVVSTRARKVIEKIAPDHAQFLPVTMVWRRSVLPLDTYWIVNWNRRVDCWNHRAAKASYIRQNRRSGRSLREVRKSAEYCHGVMIDPLRVPKGTEAFIVAGSNRKVISDRLRRALISARITGCGYHGVPVEKGSRKPANPSRYLTKFDPPATLKPANNHKTRLASLKIKAKKPKGFIEAIVGDGVTVEVDKGAGADAVKAMEKRLKLTMPDAYRDFLTTCGTAMIDGFEVLGIPPKKREQSAESATRTMRTAKVFDWPAGMLCIADDGRGGFWCLDLSRPRAKDAPVVYFDHELAVEDGNGRLQPTFEKVKPSFRSWLKAIAQEGHPGPY